MATYRCDDTRGCVMQFWPPGDEHMCSKHVETWNKLIVKQKFCASSWLITKINILRCTVSKTSKSGNFWKRDNCYTLSVCVFLCVFVFVFICVIVCVCVCVFVALFFQHANRTLLSSVACPTYHISPHYLKNGMIFVKKRGKVLEKRMFILIFSPHLFDAFLLLILLRTIMKYVVIHVKCPSFLLDFNQTSNFSTDFRQILRYQIS